MSVSHLRTLGTTRHLLSATVQQIHGRDGVIHFTPYPLLLLPSSLRMSTLPTRRRWSCQIGQRKQGRTSVTSVLEFPARIPHGLSDELRSSLEKRMRAGAKAKLADAPPLAKKRKARYNKLYEQKNKSIGLCILPFYSNWGEDARRSYANLICAIFPIL